MHPWIGTIKKKVVRGYHNGVYFLRTKVTKVQYIILTATLTGLVSGIMAVLLKNSVHQVEKLVQHFSGKEYLFLLCPAAGLLLTTWIIQRFFRGHIDKGIAMVLKAIARKSAFIPSRNNYIHFITSALTVGSGGSAGLESPIVATGSSLGSTMGRLGLLNYSERTLMIGCGAAAGIAAVYDAPIAGVMFAVEVLLAETMVSYFVPLIIAAVVGALCSKVYLGKTELFHFALQQGFNYNNVPFYFLMGVGAGFLSLYYAKAFRGVDGRFHHWKKSPYAKALTGGLMLAMFFLLFAPLYGEGYESVKMLADGTPEHILPTAGWLHFVQQNVLLLIFTGCILLLKPITAAITIGAGGNGGNFAPSVFVGAYWGFFFSRLGNATGWLHLPEGNFTLVGMAGVLAGVMYCPLTAIFLIAEITNGYDLIIPLMIVSTTAYFIAKTFEPYYMETKQLAMSGQIFTHRRERNILSSLSLDALTQRDHTVLHPDDSFLDLVRLIQREDKNIFAVVDKAHRLAGIVELGDIKHMLFQPESYDKTLLKDILKQAPAVLSIDTPMTNVMQQFDETRAAYLPVVDEERRFLGFVSKSRLFEQYRSRVAQQKDIYEED
ncbi:chloride channel protein [Dinghuibacter silviterrae]|uniref:CIC family chloride channel protein n=1 Tax=Dinghuibacter silviterrae TaxID=1539049 RepID=A0A4R8DIA3_9BACT|nr:chloride channel protein [Dinghuibacter silviterrae]TDW97295.1 CIC family chloride channel protein [Dinghuibacter silviterrae]